METDVLKLSECPDCASRNIIKSLMREQLICRECGLIFEPFVAGRFTSAVEKLKVKAGAVKKKSKNRKR